MKTAATVFITTLVFVGLGVSFVAGCVTGLAIADAGNNERERESLIRPNAYYNKYYTYKKPTFEYD